MTETGLTNQSGRPTSYGMKRMLSILALGAAATTSSCVNVTAPDKPIEINLNINVTQQVVYRLDGEAKSLIQQNPDIF
jgi:hypothetical protein